MHVIQTNLRTTRPGGVKIAKTDFWMVRMCLFFLYSEVMTLYCNDVVAILFLERPYIECYWV